jgi:hypothetical protein
MGGKASRTKGHGFEREIAAWLRETVGIDAKRGLSQPRGGTAEEPDVLTPGGWPLWLECKRGKKTDSRAALRQARDAVVRSGADCWPVAICRDDQEEATAMMPLELLGLLLLLWDRRSPKDVGYKVTRAKPVATKAAPKPPKAERRSAPSTKKALVSSALPTTPSE